MNIIPSFNQILNKINKTQINIRSERTLEDLEEISSIQTNHIQNSLSNILRTMDKNGLVNQKGYQRGLKTLRQAVTYFSKHKDASSVTEEMTDTFNFLFLRDGGGRVCGPPIPRPRPGPIVIIYWVTPFF